MALLKTRFAARALQQGWLIRLLKWLVPPLDRFLLRISRGWINTAMQTIVLMETTGARSGARRETVTLCLPDGDDLLLVGSNWGLPQHPAWVFNLRAHPQARVVFRGYRGLVSASEVRGAERAAAWAKLVDYNPQYAVYAGQTERELPVVRLAKLRR